MSENVKCREVSCGEIRARKKRFWVLLLAVLLIMECMPAPVYAMNMNFGDPSDYAANKTTYLNQMISPGETIQWNNGNSGDRTYTVTYQNPDGTAYSPADTVAGDYSSGELVKYTVKPITDFDASLSTSFKCWKLTNVSYNTGFITAITLTAVKKASYTITWKNDDGSTIDTTTVNEGDMPSHADPGKAETAEYTYTFAGWTPAPVAATADATYTATYTPTKKSYTITWRQDDGTLIDTTTVEYGSVPSHADASKSANAQYTYTFAGWSPAVTAVTGAAVYQATYTASVNKYTVKWNNYDGTELEKDTDVPYGTTPVYNGATPTKPADSEYTYKFDKWTPDISDVTGDVTYTAVFAQEEKNKCKIKFVDEDGTTVLKETSYAVGTPAADIERPADPKKAATVQYTYTFAGWSPAIKDVTADATYKATYTSTVNKYSVTWVNYDGTELEKDTDVSYGTKPKYNGKTPQKPADDQYTYKFDKWSPAISKVTGDITYTATYTAKAKKSKSSTSKHSDDDDDDDDDKDSSSDHSGDNKDAETNGTSVGNTGKSRSPQTGDQLMGYSFWICLIMVGFGVCVAAIPRRKREEE